MLLWKTLTLCLAVEVIRNNMAARQNDLRLYLDVIPDPTKVRLVALHRYSLLTCILKPDPPAQSIMIFLKHFDTSKQTLYGAGKTYMLRNSKVGDLAPIINERMRWTPGTPLKLYEVTSTQTSDATVLTISHQEIKPGMIELMKLKLSFSQNEIQDGDVICFQVDLPDKE
jgi:ubiquitin carboxyl-terminal hydrolase 7